MNRRRILLIGVLGLVVLLPLIWWLCSSESPGDLHQARANHGAVLLPNGQVLVIGGEYSTTPLIDPYGGLGNFVGGVSFWKTQLQFLWTANSWPLASCELFDPKTRRWTMAKPLHRARAASSAILLPDGTVLEGDSTWAELYEDGRWTETRPFPSDMFDNILLPNGEVMGFPMGLHPSIYNPKSRTWTQSDLPCGWQVVLGNGLLLVAIAGEGGCHLYNSTTRTWKPTGDFLLGWGDFRLVALPDGRALAIGGMDDDGGYFHKECEIFDPKTETWKGTGDLNIARGGDVGLVRLHDGQVLAIGGTYSAELALNDPAKLNTCELYNPATGVWTKTGSMTVGRQRFTATVLQDGQVLVTGGYSGSYGRPVYFASCELYDPKTGTWSRL